MRLAALTSIRPGPLRVARWLGRPLLWAAALALAACAQAPPPPTSAPAPAQVSQPVAIRVLDARDRPVVGAQVVLTPQAGQAQEPGPYLTDPRGEVRLTWRPEVVNALARIHSQDQVFIYNTRLDYKVEAPGYLSALGRLEGTSQQRSLANAELSKLDASLAVGSLSETVVLHRPQDLLGRGLSERPLEDPLAARCLAFFAKDRLVAARLGAEFAWPSFVLKGQSLTLRFKWRGITWGGLKQAPLAGRVALTSGLPLATAAGQDLLPLPGVQELVIEFHHEVPPEGDALAAPLPAKVIMSAPVQDVADLAARRLTPDQFLVKHPPQLVVADHPGGQL